MTQVLYERERDTPFRLHTIRREVVYGTFRETWQDFDFKDQRNGLRKMCT